MTFVSDAKPMRLHGWINRLISKPTFQDWANRVPGLRRIARRDGEEIFHIVQGFVRSQVLYALIALDVPERLLNAPASAEMLGLSVGISQDRMAILLQAGAGLGLLKRKRDGRFTLTRKGAATVGVPGLKQMILHHGALYRDLTDPVGLLKDETETELAEFWPYVFATTSDVDPEVTQTYSDLMADSQTMVARDTLAVVSLSNVMHLVDVGGGSGAFLTEVANLYSAINLTLFDLPNVMPSADKKLSQLGLGDRVARVGGSFRDDPLPVGADAISLIRVLYDHDDETVMALLSKVYDSLPAGGRLIVSEPMSGGDRPDPITDVYFAFYTLAMRTGRVRSAATIKSMCKDVGFADVNAPRSKRSFVTSVVTAKRH